MGQELIWDEENIEKLKKLWGKSPYIIAAELKTSARRVKAKAEELGLEPYSNNNWSEEEIQILRENADKYYYRELTKLLPGRSLGSISGKAWTLGIPLITQITNLSDEDKKYIVNNWSKKTNEQIMNHLNISYAVLNRYKKELGLPTKKNKSKWTEKNIEKLKQDVSIMSRKELAEKYKTSVKRINNICSQYKIDVRPKRPNWTKKDDIQLLKYIKDGLTYHEIAKLMDRPYSSICRYALNLGIKRIENERMNDAIVNYIIENKDVLTSQEIAEHLGLNERQVINKAGKLGIKLKRLHHKKIWTEEQDRLLINYSNNHTVTETAKYIGFSAQVVRAKAKKLGISFKKDPGRVWTYQELKVLQNEAPNYTVKELADMLNRSETSVRSKLKNMGLKAKRSDYFWTEEETNRLLELYKENKNIYEISNIMNKPYGAIQLRLDQIGVKIYDYETTTWTEEELNELFELYNNHSIEEIAVIMNKNESSVKYQLSKHGKLKVNSCVRWTQEDLEYLKDNWGYLSIQTLMNNLNRSELSICEKAHQLGLGRMIDANYETITLSDLSNIMQVHQLTIIYTWGSLGLNIRTKKISDFKSYRYVDLEELFSFLEQHQDIWDSRLVERYGLVLEPDWLKEKRKKDAALDKYEYFDIDTLKLQQLKELKMFIDDETNAKKKKK
jgi:DNA-binding CsgD family transcriptional regulator